MFGWMNGSRVDQLPMLHLDGAALPPAERLAAFAQIAAGYAVTPLTPDFMVDSRAWHLGELVITASELTAVRIERTAAHIRADRRDSYSLIMLRHGSWNADTSAGFVQVASGQIGVMDYAEPWLVEGTGQDNVIVVVPRALAEQIAPDSAQLNGRVLGGASGRLLAEHVMALAQHLPALSRAEAASIQQATINLIAAALNALPKEHHAPFRHQRQIGGKVLAYIETRLTDLDLSVATICRDVGVSRATLYRAFKEVEGVAAYILDRRLEAAHGRIADPAEQASIAEIADRFCFSSPARFSTAFRRRFGYTPVSARGVPAQARELDGLFDGWRRVLAIPPETEITAQHPGPAPDQPVPAAPARSRPRPPAVRAL
jgi:AraC-like DNA-binding protein